MLDIRLLRDQPDFVKERLAQRGGGVETRIDAVLDCDRQRRAVETRLQQFQAERKRVSKEIGARKGRGEDTTPIEQQVRGLGDEIAALNAQAAALEEQQRALLLELPNLPHADCPLGADASANPVVRMHGSKLEIAGARDHVALCERLEILDLARGARLAGSGFICLKGAGARLERALTNFCLDLHTREHGYTEVATPFLVRGDILVGTGQLPKFRDQLYAVADEDLFLIPTAEVPVTNLHREEILTAAELPLRYVACTPCFRSEAGAAGVGTRGMIRVHQFNKVELVKITTPETSFDELESLTANAERVLQLLGLHYRVVELCTGDLGFGAARTYDLEVWAPGQQAWLEVSSCSNFTDFQARRMQLRYRRADGKTSFCHTLNGSGTALPRLFVALVETWQQPDGSVTIPEALRPYFGADKL